MNYIAIHSRQFVAFYCLLLILILQGCVSANPIAAANSTELRAYAVSGTYGIFQEKGLELIQRGNLPNSVSLRLISLEERATPVVDELDKALDFYEGVKEDLAAGASSNVRLSIALRELNKWLTETEPLVNSFKAAVKGAD